ncbi:MAG TPA: FimV/HubP family polar landmark protein [Casimicrobiaceae bacterium]|nr:FimV/HubP family polar landmark protein [Casimicrobiaceae bacterium]
MRAKPLFTLTLVASALALPVPVYALALGKLTVTSALGQPLVAQIDLASATREELDSLQAKIADPSLYRQNNLSYQGVLSRARISVERTPDGRAMLRVTSPTPVNEPYLDLMVDVSWASGRVVREYTFLLDPPGQATMATVDPVAPARVGAPTTTTAAAPQAPAPVGRTAAAAAPATAPADGHVVQRGETLSKIANQYKPSDVTLEQMLVALFNANANAFDGNNMNRLRSGAIVAIPSAQEASSAQPVEASRVVRVQASDWRAYRDRVAAAAPSVDGSGTRAAGGRIGAAVEDRAGAPPAGRDQVRVSREAGVGRGGASAAEDAVARNKQLAEANARIADLEKTVADMKRALELRSQTLAQAQTQADAAKGKAPAPTVAPPVTTTPTPVIPPVATAPPVVTTPPAPTVTPAPIKPEPPKAAEPVKAPEPIKAAEPPKAAEPVKAPEPAPIPAVVPPVKPAPAPVVTAKPAPKAEPSFFDDLMTNTPTWVIGAGALALLGGIAALVAARRRKTTKFEDSIISGTDIKTNTVFGSTGGGVVNTGENSLASDFSREGLGNIDTDEVDPIAEAEVYLAYGRDAQAEEILKDALKKDPQRQEIYLKLLEIHAQHNKPSAFETVASELYAVSQGQGEVWQKAVALGRQLDPNNPMFAEGGAMPPVHVAAATGGAAAAAGATSFAPDITPVKVPGKPDVLDFQLDEEISIAPTSGTNSVSPIAFEQGPTTIQRAGEHLDFTSDKARVGSAASAASAAALAGSMTTARAATPPSPMEQKVEAVRREVADKLDFDFRLDDDEKPEPMARREPAVPVGHGVAESGPLGGSSLTRPVAAIELDKLDLGFDPERATFEDPTPSVLDGQWHDAATKLDLAKAYQEMGDMEGAREILQEVLHEGDDQQKSEANALLAKLA